MATPTMDRRTWGLLVMLSVLWGGSFFFVEVAADGLPPLTLATLRVGIAAAVLLAVVWEDLTPLSRVCLPWGAFLTMGVLNNVIPFVLIAWAQTRIDSGTAAILNATTPLFTVILAHWLTRDERLTVGRFAGVCVGIVGVAVLMGPQAMAGLGGETLAEAAVLCAACSYAFAGIFGRRLRAVPPMTAAAGMLGASTLILTPVALALDRPWTLAPGWPAVAAVIGLALLSTALAYRLYFRILNAAGATNLLLVTFLIPVTAIFLGAVVLGERLPWTAFAGMVLILGGLTLVDGRLTHRITARFSAPRPVVPPRGARRNPPNR